MSLQYISDSTGQTTGVYIPINEWNKLKSKYKGIEQDEIEVPEWHKTIVQQRLKEFNKNQNSALGFEDVMNGLESDVFK